jgi:polysaccharide export outer membrane protein
MRALVLAPALLFYIVLSIAIATGIGACASQPITPAPPPSIDTAADYELGPGDQLRVNVFNQTNLSGDVVVDGGGFIAMPLLGPLEARNKTPRELEQSIAQELMRGGYLVDPRVAVQVVQFRPYYILGEIASPGAYPYSTGLTVRNAVAAARGFTYRANTRRVYIQHAGDGEELLYELTPATPVRPGDTLRIPERLF